MTRVIMSFKKLFFLLFVHDIGPATVVKCVLCIVTDIGMIW